MNDIIATKDQQLIITVQHKYEHRPNKTWNGCLEIEMKDYTMRDILILANEEPDTIRRVLVLTTKNGVVSVDDITDKFLDWSDENLERSNG